MKNLLLLGLLLLPPAFTVRNPCITDEVTVTLVRLTNEVDAARLAAVADSVGVPRLVMWSVAWEESRTGSKLNLYRGPGRVYTDSLGVEHRICREIGRMQLSPCVSWTFLDPVRCTRTAITTYQNNIYCGALNLARLHTLYGDWEDAIQRNNGAGSMAIEYKKRVLITVGRYSLIIPAELRIPDKCPVQS